jgi:hypothetical protein
METLYLKGTLHLKQSLRESLQQKMKKSKKKIYLSHCDKEEQVDCLHNCYIST